ncbi:MAG: FprA family A-type flavoprotein [Candidatus Micrarchaeota archaeon]
MGALEIAPDVFMVGAKDYKRRIFDALIPLPEGTTYNAYLVRGSEKNALIDTVNPGFEKELLLNVMEKIPLEKLDYLIMNHAEPDHGNAIPEVLEEAKNAKLLTSKVGAQAAKDYYGVPDERMQVVDETTRISLGEKTLRFIDAPWLHWPETMFTYLEEDKILFPCDFFGQHLALKANFDNELSWDELEEYAKRYYGEIMLPFRGAGQKALEKLKALEIKKIAPSHGLIYTSPEKIMISYSSWASGKLAKHVLIVYVSMWGTTEKMAKELGRLLRENGILVSTYDLQTADLGEIARDLVDTACVVVAAPTVLGGVHPTAMYATYLVKALRPPVKYAAVISSHGWSPMAAKAIAETLKGTNIEVIGVAEAKARPKKEDFDKVGELAKIISAKLNALA